MRLARLLDRLAQIDAEMGQLFSILVERYDQAAQARWDALCPRRTLTAGRILALVDDGADFSQLNPTQRSALDAVLEVDSSGSSNSALALSRLRALQHSFAA